LPVIPEGDLLLLLTLLLLLSVILSEAKNPRISVCKATTIEGQCGISSSRSQRKNFHRFISKTWHVFSLGKCAVY
jgi:hypothetical protein